ncbi:extracellular solute-binding protein [Patescibacteria group bacterium]|nr:MAG: extracellular solute-binding protein [Patescibacteria group bacterium]
MKTKIGVLVGILGIAFIFSGCSLVKQEQPGYKLTLEVWGPFDDTRVMEQLISRYKSANPFVEDIKYRKVSYTTYKQDLINALASGKGPDIFFISNNWVPSFADKIAPAPGAILGEQEFRNTFVDTVLTDFLIDQKVLGAPLSVDSLGLYYNKDLFNAAGITTAPTNWDEFRSDVAKMTSIDATGNITQAGAALGTAFNVNRSTDILSLLMLQKNTRMSDRKGGSVWFAGPYDVSGASTHPGEEALKFYTEFADSRSPYYTWNPQMHYSIDSFVEGKTGMMFNYSFRVDEIKKKNPKLNFAVARVPQFSSDKPVDYPNYYGLVVAANKFYDTGDPDGVKKTATSVSDNDLRLHEAWELVRYLTLPANGKVTLSNRLSGNAKDFPMDVDPAEEYLKSTGRPAARRDLIEKQKSDPFLGPFALENLIAKNWYQPDQESVETILAEMIDAVNKGNATASAALSSAASRIGKLMK